MNECERMEEIQRLISERDKFANVNGQTDYPNYDEWVYQLNDNGHIDWLIKYAKEQAERAIKNAQDLEDMDRQLASEQKQNKRYRESIEKSIRYFQKNRHMSAYNELMDALEDDME